ncbi:uncharacterized protein F4822DRAFT_45648 [Hypoxylon trugodes]|uniref:uncharacterized protein n=1 Tax=Hypoxylon trugodes TaxID=326681 RepID=UPI002192FC26|nr:uncharacterized protein F4822DRAFT_45648 [Hypoxylon trugodes]KAI1394354.1 hypothetical protein F4822DRAFT_45648 [Hypoxylon trugodes]
MDRVVFRLRQLPQYVDRLDTVQLLSKALGIGASEIRIFSLACSVDPWLPSKVATLMFDDVVGIHHALQEGGRPGIAKLGDEWSIAVENFRDALVLDTHFRGLTPLYDPVSHQADCIAISGLASHPFGSWQPKGHPKTFMWIRDALPQSLPSVRPILYGYDTTLLRSRSFQSIFDLAIGLIGQLKANGWSSPTCKPLVFLAHSLGGVVLKQAFVSLANRIERDDGILRAMKGAVFFGVPNLGMEQSHLLAVVDGQPNEQLIADLSPESAYLQKLDKQFNGISCLQDALLYWCYETRKSPTVILNSKNVWSKSGLEEVLVTPDSATRGLYGTSTGLDFIFPINEDHSNMVKFSENDPNYSVVVQKLLQIFSAGEMSESKPTTTGISHLGTTIAQGPINVRAYQGPNFQSVLNSLEVAERDRRLEEIEGTFGNTFDWIYDRSEPGFTEWLRNGTGLFWIHGKPGSGKSTLMKFIFQDDRTADLLADWKEEITYVRGAFFFHYRGSSLQKSFEGLLRSIIGQILTELPSLFDSLKPLFDHATIVWTLPMLKKAFNNILRQNTVPLHLCLFLDALDEYDGRLEFICQFLNELGAIPPNPNKSIKICFSSRPWDIFVNTFQNCPNLQIHDFTTKDIEDYCLGSIRAERLPYSVSLEDLIPDIVARSRGVFLWVRLVVKDLARATRLKSMDKTELEILLQSSPTELDAYYAEIITRIPHIHRWKTYALLEVTVRSRVPLGAYDLIRAISCSEFRTYQDAYQAFVKLKKRTFYDSEELVVRELSKYCGGLIEVINSGPYIRYIQVLHQTVEDFVLDPKFKQIVLGDRAKITVENGNTFLAKSLFVRSAFQTIASSYSEITPETNASTYANAAERTTGRSLRMFLNSIPTHIFEVQSSDTPELQVSGPLAYAVYAGLRLYVIESLIDAPDLIRNSGRPLLSHAILGLGLDRFPEEELLKIAKLLLDRGFTIHRDPEAFRRLITSIVRSLQAKNVLVNQLVVTPRPRHVGLVELFLDHGQDPNVKIQTLGDPRDVEFTPLHVGPFIIANMLLDRGASPNELSSTNMTPLDNICSCYLRWRVEKSVQRPQVQEIYKLVCSIAARGGKLKNVKNEYWKEFLEDISLFGWPIDVLQSCTSSPSQRGTSSQSFSQSLNRSFDRSPGQMATRRLSHHRNRVSSDQQSNSSPDLLPRSSLRSKIKKIAFSVMC